MAEVTVKELAETVGIPVDRLLVQLSESGLPHAEASSPNTAKITSTRFQLFICPPPTVPCRSRWKQCTAFRGTAPQLPGVSSVAPLACQLSWTQA